MADIIPINIDLNTLFEAKLTYGFDPLKEAIAVSLHEGVKCVLNGGLCIHYTILGLFSERKPLSFLFLHFLTRLRLIWVYV